MFTCLISSVAVWHTETLKVLLQQLLNLTTTQLEDIDRDLREGLDEMDGLAKLILIYGPDLI